jgi:alkylated DNA nucleotide flippase Atl1
MATTRADLVAEILWELKRASKLATYTVIARRAGFSAGTNGRTMDSCLKVVRRDWPHLHWWRAIKDDGPIETEQEQKLKEAGFEVALNPGSKKLTVVSIETHCMIWESPTVAPVSDEKFHQFARNQVHRRTIPFGVVLFFQNHGLDPCALFCGQAIDRPWGANKSPFADMFLHALIPGSSGVDNL